jgi:hypothetical protein
MKGSVLLSVVLCIEKGGEMLGIKKKKEKKKERRRMLGGNAPELRK